MAAGARERPAAERREDFCEVVLGARKQWAVAEASRCLLCNEPPCQSGCPAGVDVPRFIRALKSKNFRGALKALYERNALPGICARVCPQEALCEQRCTSTGLSRPVEIGVLQRFVADEGRRLKAKAAKNLPEPSGPPLAVVGSGPAGLACAAELRRLGHPVVIFEKDEAPGGMLRFAIPAFRLPSEIVDHEIDLLLRMGIEVRVGESVTEPAALLERGFAAVFLGVGLGRDVALGLPGETLAGVEQGRVLLRRVSRALRAGGEMPALAGPVAVLGGGNTAVDAARTAVRLGAAEVAIYYRRCPDEMPAEPGERRQAKEEGVVFHFCSAPVALLGEEGALCRLRLVRTEPGEVDASGRRRPCPVPGSEWEAAAATCLLALGQAPAPAYAAFARSPAGGETDAPEPDLATVEARIFRGGDLASGGATVVRAIAEGRRAAELMDRFVRERG